MWVIPTLILLTCFAAEVHYARRILTGHYHTLSPTSVHSPDEGRLWQRCHIILTGLLPRVLLLPLPASTSRWFIHR